MLDTFIDCAFAFGDWLQRNSGAVSLVFAAAVAAFTCYLAYITGKLWDSTREAAEAARKSADTAADAFTQLERPYLLVFGVSKLGASFYSNVPGQMGTPRVDVSFGNYGKSPAIVEDARAQFSVGYEPAPPLGVEEGHSLLQQPVFSAGESRSICEKVPNYIKLDGLQPILEAGRDLFFWVVISYRGPFTAGHETSACWHYDSHERVFVRFGGDDFNYTK
jgi:hypothetical protein